MGRQPQPHETSHGSLFWTQRLVNDYPELCTQAVLQALGLDTGLAIKWMSPLADDEFAEYFDSDFIACLGLQKSPRVALADFWPSLGPHWDALGKGPNDEIFLIEAKANVVEIVSDPTEAQGDSLKTILKRLSDVQRFMGVNQKKNPPEKWANTFYQYANRIAHLYYFRHLNQYDAYLCNVCFINDPDTNGPTTSDAWNSVISVVEKHLGIPKRGNPLSAFAAHAVIDVCDLGSR